MRHIQLTNIDLTLTLDRRSKITSPMDSSYIISYSCLIHLTHLTCLIKVLWGIFSKCDLAMTLTFDPFLPKLYHFILGSWWTIRESEMKIPLKAKEILPEKGLLRPIWGLLWPCNDLDIWPFQTKILPLHPWVMMKYWAKWDENPSNG